MKRLPIEIGDKIRPFSHLPGTKMPLPFSEKGIQVFPAAINLLPENRLIALNITGPVKNFTCMLDLELGVVKVFGEAQSGYFRYYVFSENDRIYFYQDRGNPVLPEGILTADKLPASKKFEKFSLGSNKTLDFDLVKRRMSLSEILPIWYRLGQMFEPRPAGLEVDFKNQFNAGFTGIFYPEHVEHLGIDLPPLENSLARGFNKIRSLLILEKETVSILPEILPLFPHGKVMGLQTSFGEIDIEWTKNHIRQMVVDCKNNAKIDFSFPKTHKNCRLRTVDLNLNLSLNCTLDLRAGARYYFTHFQE